MPNDTSFLDSALFPIDSTGPRPAVFLDRDGTLIKEVSYLRHWKEVEILPNAIEAVRRLNQQRLPAIVATNQSVVARGWLAESQLQQIHRRLRGEFRLKGALLEAFYYCPHHPEATVVAYKSRCSCRKPAPGLLLQAAKELNLDLGNSIMIGDNGRDIEAGKRAGCQTILLQAGPCEGADEDCSPDHRARHLLEAVEWALEQQP